MQSMFAGFYGMEEMSSHTPVHIQYFVTGKGCPKQAPVGNGGGALTSERVIHAEVFLSSLL